MNIPVEWSVVGPAVIVGIGALVALLVDAFYPRRTWLGSGLPSSQVRNWTVEPVTRSRSQCFAPLTACALATFWMVVRVPATFFSSVIVPEFGVICRPYPLTGR
jgi:hypothetical protein